MQSGTRRPIDSTVRKSSRSSARRMTSTVAPISSTFHRANTGVGELDRRVEGRIPREHQAAAPSGRSFSSADTRPSRVERLEVGRVERPGSVMIVAGLELQRRSCGRPPRAARLLSAWRPGVVDLAGLADDDRPRADDADQGEGRYAAAHGLAPELATASVSATRTGLQIETAGGLAQPGSAGAEQYHRQGDVMASRASGGFDGEAVEPGSSRRAAGRTVGAGWFAPRWPKGSL